MPPRRDINVATPALPADITGEELDRAVRAELSTLPALSRDDVARHLVAAGQLIDEDPEAAFAHAVAARRRASRIASVREAVGLTAYALGRYEDALPELRAARRMTGSVDLLPVIADVERALGHPERALAMAVSDEAKRLDADGLIEMRIVASGARRDLGQLDAAVLTLQVPEARTSPRLAFAYADALAAVGRDDEARKAFVRASALDVAGQTDAARRLAEIDGVAFLEGDEDDEGLSDDIEPDDSGEHEADVAAQDVAAQDVAAQDVGASDVEDVPATAQGGEVVADSPSTLAAADEVAAAATVSTVREESAAGDEGTVVEGLAPSAGVAEVAAGTVADAEAEAASSAPMGSGDQLPVEPVAPSTQVFSAVEQPTTVAALRPVAAAVFQAAEFDSDSDEDEDDEPDAHAPGDRVGEDPLWHQDTLG